MQQAPFDATGTTQASPAAQPAGGPQIVSAETHEDPQEDGGAKQIYNQKDAEGNVAQQVFEYSRCTGRKRAVLIGINYIGTMNQLSGCINDANNLKAFITRQFGYNEADIKMLTDDRTQDPANLPTKANIVAAMKWLVNGAQKDDSLFFQYSGHGTTMNDANGEERDNQDEAICPLDFEDEGMIVDDESDHALLVKPLPSGCRLTCLFDSCFSETVMDLPYVYTPQGNIKRANLFLKHTPKEILEQVTAAVSSAVDKATEKKKHDNQAAQQENIKINTSPADVILWAGSMDSQTSADTFEEGKATGAMSYAFIKSLTKEPQQSYIGLLRTIQAELKGRYTQIPQLSSCHPIDVSLDFIA